MGLKDRLAHAWSAFGSTTDDRFGDWGQFGGNASYS